MRIGIGHDTHRLIEGRTLVLGGAEIPFERGSDGHSDGDALTHAIADAILGALCEGDLGVHFPDTESQWKDADSLQLLSRVMWLAHERALHIVNLDATIMLASELGKQQANILVVTDHAPPDEKMNSDRLEWSAFGLAQHNLAIVNA